VRNKNFLEMKEKQEEKVWGKTSHFTRLRWDGDALLIKYQPRLFNYLYHQASNALLSIFFAGNYADKKQGRILQGLSYKFYSFFYHKLVVKQLSLIWKK
jgi:hypothetical protein